MFEYAFDKFHSSFHNNDDKNAEHRLLYFALGEAPEGQVEHKKNANENAEGEVKSSEENEAETRRRNERKTQREKEENKSRQDDQEQMHELEYKMTAENFNQEMNKLRSQVDIRKLAVDPRILQALLSSRATVMNGELRIAIDFGGHRSQSSNDIARAMMSKFNPIFEGNTVYLLIDKTKLEQFLKRISTLLSTAPVQHTAKEITAIDKKYKVKETDNISIVNTGSNTPEIQAMLLKSKKFNSDKSKHMRATTEDFKNTVFGRLHNDSSFKVDKDGNMLYVIPAGRGGEFREMMFFFDELSKFSSIKKTPDGSYAVTCTNNGPSQILRDISIFSGIYEPLDLNSSGMKRLKKINPELYKKMSEEPSAKQELPLAASQSFENIQA